MGRETMALKLRVGAAQIAPKFFDKAGTLKKTLQVIEEAGRLSLDLLVFPETYFSAYPCWRGSVSVRCPKGKAAPSSSADSDEH